MPDPTMHCHLCPEVTAIDAILDHVRLMHPDVWDGTPVTIYEQFAELQAATREFVVEVRQPFVWILDRLIRLPGLRREADRE